MRKIWKYGLALLLGLCFLAGPADVFPLLGNMEAEAAVSFLKTPVLESAEGKSNRIVVTWKTVKRADFYLIYRKEAGKKYEKVAVQSAYDETSYVDRTVKPGRLYTYTVVAAEKSTGITVKSDYNKEGVSARVKIPAVELQKLEMKSGRAVLKWKAMQDVTGYRIYRKDNGGSYQLVKEITDVGTTSWKDSKLESGHTYTYTVQAWYQDGNEIVKGKYDSTGLSLYVEVPGTKLVSAQTGSGNIMVRWERIPEADGYIIYRREEGGSYHKCITVTNTTMDYCWDTDAVPGIRYSYALRTYKLVDGKAVKSQASYLDGEILCLPEAPLFTGLKKNTWKDVLTWTEVEGADGYILYKKSAETGKKWEKAAVVNKNTTEYKLIRYEGGTTTYAVRAFVKLSKNIALSLDYDTISNKTRKYTDENILFDGDSITWGYTWGKERAEVTFPDRVSQITGCDYTNVGVSNSTVARRSSSDQKSLVARAKSGETDYRGYSVICIAAGTNDYNYDVPMGVLGDDSEQTFFGAWENIFMEIRRQNPDAKVVLVTPVYRGRYQSDWSQVGMKCKNSCGYTLEDYTEAIRRVANRHGAYVYNSSVNGVITKANYRMSTFDSLHPVRETYAKMGELIADFMIQEVF
ncbi:MAG: GDSL-type esterase/lipase family protein [Clostridiales bacterium]|nr:GDSL-type esterase/lipase family protein [Clostridiales bacterium]